MKCPPMSAPIHTRNSINTFLDKMSYSNVPGRLFLFFLSGNSALLAYVPESVLGFLYKDTPQVAVIVLCVAVLGVLDTIVNDLMPDRFHFRFGCSVRHIALMLCAAYFALCTYLTVMSTLSWPVIFYFVAPAITIAVHTFFDLRRRFKWEA